MVLWSRAEQCQSGVPGKCTARCESLLNSSTCFLFTLQAQDNLFPTTELPTGALMEHAMRSLPDKRGLFDFVLKLRELSSFICGDMAQASLGEILAFLKSKKSKKSSHCSFSGTRISTTYTFQCRVLSGKETLKSW